MSDPRATNTPNMQAAVGGSSPNNIRPSIPQVQLIHQPVHSPPYMPQMPYNQQQLNFQSFQNAVAVQAAMQANVMNQQYNLAAMQQGRAPPSASPKSPLLSPNAGVGQINMAMPAMSSGQVGVSNAQTQASNASKTAANSSKATGSNNVPLGSPASAAIITSTKTIMTAQQAQPLFVGQLGVVPGQPATTYSTYATQGKQPMTVSGAHAVQPQLITSQASLRLPNQPQLVTNTGQIITSQPMLTNQAMLQAMASLQQQQGIPMAHQSIIGAQPPTILSGQPLYIRTTGPLQHPQGMQAVANLQPLGTVKAGKIEMPTNLQMKAVASGPKHQNIMGHQTKAILPSSKSNATTAKVQPTMNYSLQAGAKLNIPTVTPKVGKVRAKSITKSATATSAHSAAKQAMYHNQSKAQIASNQSTSIACKISKFGKSQSDSEVETGRKSVNSMIKETTSLEKTPDMTQSPAIDASKDTKLSTSNHVAISENLKEKPLNDLAENHHILPQPPVVEKQKAIVRPQVLTHVIEGFVIQEGPQPFPVQRSSLLTEYNNLSDKDGLELKPAAVEMEVETTTKVTKETPEVASRRCEFCGSYNKITRFHRSKRFCSMACAKRYNVGCRKTVGGLQAKSAINADNTAIKRKLGKRTRKGWRRRGRGAKMSFTIDRQMSLPVPLPPCPEDDPSSTQSSPESSLSPTSPLPPHNIYTPEFSMAIIAEKNTPDKWTIQDVYEFIKSMPGCENYADEFRSQDIDGQALLLLKEDHLMTAMSMKLGPALKICARINSLKDSV